MILLLSPQVLLNQSNFNYKNNKPYYKEIKINGKYYAYARNDTLLPLAYTLYIEASKNIFLDNLIFGSGAKSYRYVSSSEKYLIKRKITFKNYVIWQDKGFNFFKKKINNTIYNINNKIVIKLNSQSNDINGVFLGLGDNGSLKIKVENEFLEYYSVDSFFFPDEELS